MCIGASTLPDLVIIQISHLLGSSGLQITFDFNFAISHHRDMVLIPLHTELNPTNFYLFFFFFISVGFYNMSTQNFTFLS